MATTLFDKLVDCILRDEIGLEEEYNIEKHLLGIGTAIIRLFGKIDLEAFKMYVEGQCDNEMIGYIYDYTFQKQGGWRTLYNRCAVQSYES